MRKICERLEPRQLLAGYIFDSSFANEGVLNLNDPHINSHTNAQLFLDGESRVIVATAFAEGGKVMEEILRFHADGTRDKTFAADGQLLIDLGEGGAADPLITILKDNSIVLVTHQADKPLLLRYTVKGKIDRVFRRNVGQRYQTLTTDFSQAEDLYTDSAGRVVFDQYVDESGFGAGNERITARVRRFLPTGLPDDSFGVHGEFNIDLPLNLPQTYRIQSRTLTRRFLVLFGAPQIDSRDNVAMAGMRDYARNSYVGPGYSHVNLPFIYSFAGDGAVRANFIAAIEADKASFVNGSLQYSGLSVQGNAAGLAHNVLKTAVTPDDTFCFFCTFGGLATFKLGNGSIGVSGFDNTFGDRVLGNSVVTIGNKAWLTTFRSPVGGADTNGLIELREDATAGEYLAITRRNSPFVYAGVLHDRPRRVIGFRQTGEGTLDDAQHNIVAANLTEQEASAKLVNGVVHITGTAGGDFISINKRSAGKRIIVTGAGPTRSFLVSSLKGVQVDALGGDDVVEADLLTVDATINGQAGDDTIFSGQGNDLIDGGSGNDYIQANLGADTLHGQRGNDTLIGGETGGDDIFGGSGHDTAPRTDDSTFDSIEVLNG